MGLILLDTSVLVDHLRDTPGAADTLDAAVAEGNSLAASVLTKVELLAGMRTGERRSVRRLLDQLVWIEVTDGIAERAGQLARRYRRSHAGVGVVDYVIAATAQEIGADLWTRNLRHFPMFPTLAAPY